MLVKKFCAPKVCPGGDEKTTLYGDGLKFSAQSKGDGVEDYKSDKLPNMEKFRESRSSKLCLTCAESRATIARGY